MAKRGTSCWFVVGYYAGDERYIGKRGERPGGTVYGTHDKRTAVREAAHRDAEYARRGEPATARAFQCDRAKRLFDLKV
jgi:hypothetical protein